VALKRAFIFCKTPKIVFYGIECQGYVLRK